MQDGIRVSQWGAFDVVNYGDQLFPLIARDQLTARLLNLELVCHAPIGIGDLPPVVCRSSPCPREADRSTGPAGSTSRDTSTPCSSAAATF